MGVNYFRIMKKLYKVIAKKIIPIVLIADEDYDKNPDWDRIETWVKHEEQSFSNHEYDMEIKVMQPLDKLGYPFEEWGESCILYSSNDEFYITLEDGRILTVLSDVVKNNLKNKKMSPRAIKEYLDSIIEMLDLESEDD